MRKIQALLGAFWLCAVLGQAQNATNGILTVANAGCVSGSCVSLHFDAPDVASSAIQLSGTFTATVQFEASSDGGTTWVAISGTPLNSSTAASSATTANTWKFNAASLTDIRARCSAFTSAPTVVIRSSKAVANATGGGGTSLPALSDNGTNVTSTEAILAPVGTFALPGYAFSGGANQAASGIFWSSSGITITNTNGATGWLGIPPNNGPIQMPPAQAFGWSSSTTPFGASNDLSIRRIAAASMGQGKADNATPVANTLTIGESSRGGTDSNVAGANGTIKPGIGTGLGAGTKLCIQRDIMGATGSTAQSTIDGYCVGPSKTLSNTTATAQSLVNISVPSNSAGGVEGTITVTCTDGTNFNSETQSFNTSFVNKATVLTVTAPVITATSAANNSGSCTAGITAVAGTNSVDIKVTPAFTTIVPTIVTSYIALRNNGTGNVTFN